MILRPEIFKAYDVRGRYPDDIDAEGAGRIAAAFVAFLRGAGTEHPSVVLGRDARPSSEPIASSVRDALVSAGARVFDVGLATTPLFYFAVNHLCSDGGVMVTASHNPPEFNGLKICRAEAVAVGLHSGLAEIRDLALHGEPMQRRSGGSIELVDALDSYVSFLRTRASLTRPLTVAIDAGNGMAGFVLEKLLPQLPELRTRKLYFTIDGTFPNHLANPLIEETLDALKRDLSAHSADLGIAFDADADRIGILAPDGSFVSANVVFSVLVKDAFKGAERGAKALYAANMSRLVPETIREYGGTPLRVKIGHANINAAMRSEGALLGGELSGHYFFREFFCRDDGILAMLRVLRMLSESASFDDLAALFSGRYVQSGEINFDIADKEGTLQRIEKAFPDARTDKLDGLTVEYDDWWFNLRPSNTEDLLRLNVEAATPERLEASVAHLRSLIGE